MKTLLSPEQVRKVLDPSWIKMFTPDESNLNEFIIGQNRAVKALHFGLGIKAEGYNIFVSGKQGTGKLTAVRNFIQEQARTEPVPDDWCYVNNFNDPYEPAKVRLPAGRGETFKKDLKNLIQEALHALTKAFEHDDFTRRRNAITDKLEKQQDALIDAVNERSEKESILIEETPMNIMTIPLKEGKPMTDDEFNSLSDDERQKIRQKQDKYIDEIRVVALEARKLEKAANEELQKLEKETASFALSPLVEEIEEKYTSIPDVLAHVKKLKEDILNNLASLFLAEKVQESSSNPSADANFKTRYEVNILVSNHEVKGAPVVLEPNPTYNNLFGRVEKESHMGTWATDLTLIRKGSLHAANGGYLIIRVEELFKNLFSWESLKRALKNKEVIIEEAGDQWGFITTKTLKPEPIPLRVKVILIGEPELYHLLYAYDNDFKELFKVKVDFDTTMLRDEKSMGDYTHFCLRFSKKEGLLPLHEKAIAKFIEYGSRLAEDQNKLSTRFSKLSDILREANYYATIEKSKETLSEHIQKAIEEKTYRSNLFQERINEMIISRQILIDTRGAIVGQVNGLSVMSLGDIDFGIPNRITCSTSIGKDGVIAIEREAELSGPIHTKGVIILSGYLSEKFIQNKPLSLNAQIVFEQNYSEIDGDSASSSELYTILSSLAEIPIRQGIAVTGSVNQKGEIQAVGGINEKIEGYFEICKRIGLNDEQGVIIPSANIQNLMLKEDVLHAIAENRFKIWAIETVDDGIEILTGVKAGSVQEEETIAFRVNQKLNQYAEKLKAFTIEDEHELA